MQSKRQAAGWAGQAACAARVAALALTGAAALTAGCGPSGQAATGRPTGRGAPQVEIAPVVVESLRQQIPAVGTVYAAEEMVVSSKVAGILIRTAVDVGQVVRPGDLLFEIEPANYRFAVEEAEAALEESLAQLGVAAVPQADFDIEQTSAVRRAAAEIAAAEFTHQRLLELRGDGSGRMVADQELSSAQRDLEVARAELSAARDTAKALLATARQRAAALAVARRRLEDASIEAPPIPTTLAALRRLALPEAEAPATDEVGQWVVVDRLATEGQYINVAAPLYRLMVNDFVLVRAQVSQRYAGQVAIGLPVEIELPEGLRPIGHIGRIRPAIDPLNRTYEIDVLVDNRKLGGAVEQAALKPGSFAKLTITTSQADDVVWAPARAVRTLAGVSTVFLYDAETKQAQGREVTVVRRAGGRTAIQGEFFAGEQMIVAGVEALTDGAAVVPASPAAASQPAGPGMARP